MTLRARLGRFVVSDERRMHLASKGTIRPPKISHVRQMRLRQYCGERGGRRDWFGILIAAISVALEKNGT